MESIDTKPRRVAASEAHTLLEQQEASGLSIAAFARQQGVEAWTLYNARTKAKRAAQPTPEFAEVRVVEEARGHQRGPIEMALPSGLTLRISADFDEVTLRRLLGVLATC